MSELTYIADYPERSVALSLSPFHRAPRIVALIKALAASSQSYEDTGFDTLLTHNVDFASGIVLDRWGEVVGQPRGGLSDEAYRGFIKARITANNVTGVPDDFIALWRQVTGALEVRYFPLSAGSFALIAIPEVPLSETQRRGIRTFIESIRPAGIGLVLIEATAGSLNYDKGPGYDAGAYARIL